MDSPSSYTVLKLLSAFIFVAINAFFVAAEFSIVKIRRSRLEEIEAHGNKKAKLANQCHFRFGFLSQCDTVGNHIGLIGFRLDRRTGVGDHY